MDIVCLVLSWNVSRISQLDCNCTQQLDSMITVRRVLSVQCCQNLTLTQITLTIELTILTDYFMCVCVRACACVVIFISYYGMTELIKFNILVFCCSSVNIIIEYIQALHIFSVLSCSARTELYRNVCHVTYKPANLRKCITHIVASGTFWFIFWGFIYYIFLSVVVLSMGSVHF